MTLSPRQRLFVEIGRKEFVRNGYGSSSIRTIAQEAGVSLSALYYHYKNKQDLLFAILVDGVEIYDSLWERALSAAGADPVDQLLAFVRANVEFRTQYPEQGRMIATEVRNLEPREAERYEERRNVGRRRIRTIIDDGIASGAFTTKYPDDCRKSILAMTAAIANWYDPNGPDTADEIGERYAEMALNLLCPGDIPGPTTIRGRGM